MDLSLVIPVFNEEKCLDELIERCLTVCRDTGRTFEVVLVDDGSRDASRRMIESASRDNPEIVGVFLNRNFGQHAAVMAGFAQSKGDVVITLDADLQNPPEEIPRLLEKTDAGHDVVGSIRQRRRDTTFRRTASKCVNAMVRRVTGADMHDYGCMLRAYSRNIVDILLSCRETTRFIPVLANAFAANPTEIKVSHAERGAGDSKYGLFKLVRLYLDLLTCMSTFPLRIATVIGGVMSFLGVFTALVLIGGRLFYGSDWAVDGTFTVFALVFIFLGGLYLVIGILGEYLARVYNDVRGRPPYSVQKVVGGSRAAGQTKNEA